MIQVLVWSVFEAQIVTEQSFYFRYFVGLEEKIMTDIKAAMKAKDKAALRGLRAIKQAFLLAKTDGSGNELTEADEVKMLKDLSLVHQGALV